MKVVAGLVLAAVLSSASWQAKAWGVGVRAGTQGVGADVGFLLNDDWSIRLGYSALQWDRSVDVTEINYDARLKLSNLSALVEWHPFGPFRLSAGIVPNRNRIGIGGLPPDTEYRINGTVYQASEIAFFRGEVFTGRRVAPYLGVGYGVVARRGLNFYADLGAMYQSSPRAELQAACSATLAAGRCAQLQSDVLNEQRQLSERINNFKWLPVVNVGVTIGF